MFFLVAELWPYLFHIINLTLCVCGDFAISICSRCVIFCLGGDDSPSNDLLHYDGNAQGKESESH